MARIVINKCKRLLGQVAAARPGHHLPTPSGQGELLRCGLPRPDSICERVRFFFFLDKFAFAIAFSNSARKLGSSWRVRFCTRMRSTHPLRMPTAKCQGFGSGLPAQLLRLLDRRTLRLGTPSAGASFLLYEEKRERERKPRAPTAPTPSGATWLHTAEVLQSTYSISSMRTSLTASSSHRLCWFVPSCREPRRRLPFRLPLMSLRQFQTNPAPASAGGRSLLVRIVVIRARAQIRGNLPWPLARPAQAPAPRAVAWQISYGGEAISSV